ncbi:unnamed protein product [Dracunculus medinensis]|uniref:Rhomboid domain-containing protein n=1 Tax=Dracunculus medinensis TaxID=318479 RepID=A0A0N4UCE0_DRAME|nr:unnamed protein product [Dracunculus medinensis]
MLFCRPSDILSNVVGRVMQSACIFSSYRMVMPSPFGDSVIEEKEMIRLQRGMYQMQNQSLFLYAPISKAWFVHCQWKYKCHTPHEKCRTNNAWSWSIQDKTRVIIYYKTYFLLSGSVIRIYLSVVNEEFISLSLRDILHFSKIGKLFILKLFYQNPSSLITALILIYYSRWIERRFGSKKFLNFLVINFFLSIISELIVFCFLSYINYDSSQIFFPCGPSALLISLYINFIREFPIVPFVSIFGISLSIHNLPFFAFLQKFWGVQELLY